jgi:hypothetical protein
MAIVKAAAVRIARAPRKTLRQPERMTRAFREHIHDSTHSTFHRNNTSGQVKIDIFFLFRYYCRTRKIHIKIYYFQEASRLPAKNTVFFGVTFPIFSP